MPYFRTKDRPPRKSLNYFQFHNLILGHLNWAVQTNKTKSMETVF